MMKRTLLFCSLANVVDGVWCRGARAGSGGGAEHTIQVLAPRSRFSRSCRLVSVVLLAELGALGCGAQDPLADEVVGSSQAELTLDNQPGTSSPFLYDGGTQCGGAHCCPTGMAMTGAHLGYNTFKCAPVAGGIGSFVRLVYGNQRNGMLSCPTNEVMVGYYAGNWWDAEHLLCGRPLSQQLQFEYVDSGTQDSFPMHVCSESSGNPYHYVMTGIHQAGNRFNCAR